MNGSEFTSIMDRELFIHLVYQLQYILVFDQDMSFWKECRMNEQDYDDYLPPLRHIAQQSFVPFKRAEALAANAAQIAQALGFRPELQKDIAGFIDAYSSAFQMHCGYPHFDEYRADTDAWRSRMLALKAEVNPSASQIEQAIMHFHGRN